MATPSASSQVSSRERSLSRNADWCSHGHAVDCLASFTDLDVFGCTLDFAHPTMQTYLKDPMWEVNTQLAIVLRDCRAFPHSESFDGCPYRDMPQAVQVPTNLAGIVPAGAFVAVPRLRHVCVEAGIKAIGAEAWQSCRHL